MKINRYDIFWADFNPKKGSRQTGIRPCVVLQSNVFNSHSPTIIVVPLTTTKRKIFPSEFLITPTQSNGLTEASRFLGHQIITLDKKYLQQKIGQLDDKYHDQINESIRIIFDLENLF